MSRASARDGPQSDGMEGLEQGPARLRFSHDSRLSEVMRPPHIALPSTFTLFDAQQSSATSCRARNQISARPEFLDLCMIE